jgi:rhamnosyltransferase
MRKIVAIVVTFHPELPVLARLLDALQHQVDSIVVVDNGSAESLAAYMESRGQSHEYFIPLGANRGISVAQNQGIAWARERDADYIVLFDQDSEPASDMVLQLLAVAENKLAAGVPLAAVGPRYLDERQDNPPPFIQVKGMKVERQPCTCSDTVADVDYLIASGCLIPMIALNKVGGMCEELFIDYVDIEWGLRAKQKGLQSFGACAATMRHDLGDEPIEFFGRKIPLHSPLRHYYHFRNAVWMYRQPWLPTHWKLADGWRLFLKYGFYTLFAKPRISHFRMMTLGILDGLRGRMGMFNGLR